MTPSKEAAEAADVYFDIFGDVDRVLTAAYAIDVAPLETRLKEAEEMIRALQLKNKDIVDEYQRMMEEAEAKIKHMRGLCGKAVDRLFDANDRVKNAINAALEEAAKVADGWDCRGPKQVSTLQQVAAEIRKMKGE